MSMTREQAIAVLMNSNEYHHAKGDLPHSALSVEAFNMAIEALKEQRPHGEWVQCSDRLPTAEDGERVLVHICFDKPACEYVYIPWKTVGFEYQVGHIDAWFAIPKYEKRGEEK